MIQKKLDTQYIFSNIRLLKVGLSFIIAIISFELYSQSSSLNIELPNAAWSYEIIDEREVRFYADGDASNEFLWDFGDGNSAPVKNPVHFYEEPFYYDVSLITTNKYGSNELILELDLVNTSATALATSVIHLHPNPNDGIFKLKIDLEKEVFLEVMDLCGLLFWSAPWSHLDEHEINLNHLPAGTYSLNVHYEEEIIQQRFVKEN